MSKLPLFNAAACLRCNSQMKP